jgi:hypothetical protein
MACVLVALDQSACTSSDGGIVKSFITDKENITDVTYDANEIITAITMSGVGLWAEFAFDTDTDQPYYNQTGERVGNKHTYNQEALITYSGINNTKRLALQALTDCCELVAVHFLSSGLALVQGLEYDSVTDVWKSTKKRMKATGQFDTQTGADDDLVGIRLISQSRKLSNFTTLTETALAAL